jgi:CRISPR-associated endonuclease Cas2
MKSIKHLIIAYDVKSNKRRTKLMNLLKDVGGWHVNLSVFEIDIEQSYVSVLKRSIKETIDAKTDRVLLYDLCAICEGNRETVGKELVLETDKVVIS